jgi:UDP-N-acetyl-2-amino-2-deoxyglucuronate dehydrogenase
MSAATSRPGVGIVGTGIIFEEHAQSLAHLRDRAKLIAVAELDEDRRQAAAAKYSIAFAYRDYHELLDRDDVDVVSVCTPPCFHEPVVVDALEAGKYVICEKPLAHTLEAADRILEVARAFPGKLSTVHQFRWLPEVRRTIWLRDNGYLGQLLFGRFQRYGVFNNPWKKPKPGKPAKPPRRDWWGRWTVAGGGETMTQLIHELDLACHIFGPATEVSAVIDTLKQEIESEDSCMANVRFDSGAIATCYGTMTAHRAAKGFDVLGQLGSVHDPWAFECMDPQRRDEAREAALAACPEPGPGAETTYGHTPYLSAVLDAIETAAPLPVGPAEARASLELAAAIYASALSSAPVSLPVDSRNPHYGGVTRSDYESRERVRRESPALNRVA